MNQLDLQARPGSPYPFGATSSTEGMNFAVYAKDIQDLTLCLFHENDLEHPFQEFVLDPKSNKTGDVWHIAIKGLPEVVAYGYKVIPTQKPDQPQDQPQNSYLLLDPYAKAIASPATWNDRKDETEPSYRPLGKAIQTPPFDWEGDQLPKIPMKDLIIYEMHVRGFTQHPSSQVQHPGTYLGIVEKIPYLKDLGVNAIELMPIHEFNECEASQLNPKTKQKLHNYFGYSTVNFFSPMNRFASQSQEDKAIREFKTMVRELHKNGIEIILDVVFNHTCEGNEQGPTLSFRGLDRRAYYMIDGQGNYLNFSGCGNTLNCNFPVTRELVIDALRYWVTEMHVDGFRFDLASIMTRAENGAPIWNPPLVEAITHDPILSTTKLIAEAWDAGGLYQVGAFVPGIPRWSEWNGKYRDVVRRYIKETPWHKTAFATAISGSQDLYGYGRAPYCSINFITAHDGFSLADLVTYNGKHNELNGEENRDGFDHNDSWNCGFEGHSNNQKIIALRERQIRNFHLALMVSQGVPMLLMGDEYAHTRHGNNNTWCQDNELNWFLWDKIDSRPGFYRFYRSLINFRKNHPSLGREHFLGEKDITWHGVQPNEPQWDNDNRLIAFTLNVPDQYPELYIAFNAGHAPQTLHLPPAGEGRAWYWVVNTHNPSPDDFFDEDHVKKVETANYRIHSYSSILLESRPIK